MSKKLVCPFCGQEVSETIWEYGERETTCFNCDITGNSKLWEELIRTREALNVAIDEVTKIRVAAESVGIGFFMTAAIVALAKIKNALEQKDK